MEKPSPEGEARITGDGRGLEKQEAAVMKDIL
jgi:hypothetical protein